ncbi:MAG: Flagellar hook-length control protein FliK [Candidatus Tokpelaia hoelldobleri]|uniref:Flagellar hook-length control protein FliK n=1 Tax=Candidatus Tokpelaia hoelldobleri TaxID=1902579 RepID=A0A1U9JSX0_9HYPH|nr:MAG: Flagellar hook-length control protein FliK [Candidatus Tokpelaia hoelldoblerii]
MITPGFLNDPLPARSPDKTKGGEKTGMTKPRHGPQHGKADDFHSLVEQGSRPGSGKPQTDEDMLATDCFSAALLFPMVAIADETAEQTGDDVVMETMPATDDEAVMEKMPFAPVVDKVKVIRRAGSAVSAPAADMPFAVAQNDGGDEGRTGKNAQLVQGKAGSLHDAEKAADGQGEKVAAGTISRKETETVAETVAARAGAAEDNVRRPVPQAAGRQGGGQDFAAPRLDAADLPAPATAVNPAEKPAQLEVGDKIILKAPAAENTMLARIEAVEVLSSRSHGDMRQLHLQLTPENLGTVEARLRLHESGLSVELRAVRTESAHFLARDHEMLVTLLKRSGFKEQSHVSVTISDQNRTVSHHVAPMAQLTGEQSAGQGSGGQNGHNGQDVRAGTQGSGQNGRGGNRPEGEDTASRKQYDRQQPDEGDRESHARRPVRGLVV